LMIIGLSLTISINAGNQILIQSGVHCQH
jgi:hypothetical protein